MLRNYIKIAWRNILKSRFYSLLNVLGLSSGLAFTMLIMAYVWNELQVNNRLNNASQQYILHSKWKDPNMGYEFATVGNLAKALKDNYPTLVKNYYRWDGVSTNVSKGEKSFRESLQIGDSTFLNMYGFKLLHGNAATALNEPFTIVITEDVANKYFGKTDVTGQTLNLENFAGQHYDYMITGVMRSPDENTITHLNGLKHTGLYLPASSIPIFGRAFETWNSPYIASFIELQPGVTAASLENPIREIIKTNAPPQIADNMTVVPVQLKTHYMERNNALVKRMLYTLSAVALFILLMAMVNFVNMSVARSSSRLKEIGVRKVMGGLKRQLILQFLVESTILVAFSALIAICLYPALRPLFSKVLNNPLPALTSFPLYFILYPLLLVIVTGFIAGVYPAFILSSLKSVDSLKGKMKTVKENLWLRRSLVGFQFFTAAVVLIGAFIITRQVQLFFSSNLGYDKSYVISAQAPRNWTPEGVSKMETLRAQFAMVPAVKSVSFSFEVPDGNNGNSVNIAKPGGDAGSDISSLLLVADEQYAKTYSIPMAGGSFFSESAVGDSTRVVINETLAKALGYKVPTDAVGRQVQLRTVPNPLTVAGVTKDFHFSSMQQAIQPMVFIHVRNFPIYRFFSFKLNGGNTHAALAAVQQKWNELMPGTPFEYKFMDETLAGVYQTELQLKQAAYIATALAMAIVLLGVLGVISLNVHKRSKEIGIRKVLGASVSGIVSLFVKEMMGIVAIAGLIACPVAYLLMQKWLEDYVYRIDINATPFILTLVCLALITVVLVITQTIRTALTNPVRSLRTE
ncbi:ABC transporter permease [uncultured Chitinophaga sp.]|uniref:ABC transporter permease n=1 Tax=uncultured Chitinophaga sp. TaxID=339340 RepID=UPI0025FAEAEE|nr:ABC transporter permease [uncultured Chitinophaga sp.]